MRLMPLFFDGVDQGLVVEGVLSMTMRELDPAVHERLMAQFGLLASWWCARPVWRIKKALTPHQRKESSMTNQLIWLTTYQAADRAGRNDQTVRRACESGELHGSQRKAGATWRIHVDCLDAWVLGVPCPHAEGNRV